MEVEAEAKAEVADPPIEVSDGSIEGGGPTEEVE